MRQSAQPVVTAFRGSAVFVAPWTLIQGKPLMVAMAGTGICHRLAMDVCPRTCFGAVVPVLSEWALPQIELWVTYSAGRFAMTKAGAFVHWFQGTMS
jgi:hypothetical protein